MTLRYEMLGASVMLGELAGRIDDEATGLAMSEGARLLRKGAAAIDGAPATGPTMPAEDLTRAKRYAAEICSAGEYAGDDGTLLSRAVLHLTRELAGAREVADRFRHGQDIEGDHVCPGDLRADAAEKRLAEVLDARALARAVKAALPELRANLTIEGDDLVIGLVEKPERGPVRFWSATLEEADYAKGPLVIAAEVAAGWHAYKAAGYRYGEPLLRPTPEAAEAERCKCPPPSGMCGDGPDRCPTCGLLVPGAPR